MKTNTNRIRSHRSAAHPSPQVKSKRQPAEFKIVRLRECPVRSSFLSDPTELEKFWRLHVETAPHFDPERETLWAFFLDTRGNLKGFQQLSEGTKDTMLFNTADVFRLASLQSAARLIVAHNHPSGDPEPSEADIDATHKLLDASKILQIGLVDHVIIGDARHAPSFTSLNEHGHFLCRNPSRKGRLDSVLYVARNAVNEFMRVSRKADELMSSVRDAQNQLKKAAAAMTAYSKTETAVAS